MKYPPNFPKLEEPNFVLDVPEWIQYSVVMLFFLGGLVFCYAVYFLNFLTEYQPPIFISIFLLFGCIVFWWLAFSSDNINIKWVSFAADKQGCYLECKDRSYYFIPWKNVGKTSIGYIKETSENPFSKSKSVFIEVIVQDSAWGNLVKPRMGITLLTMNKIENGYRNFPLGNSLRNVKKTLEEIEKIRALSKVEE